MSDIRWNTTATVRSVVALVLMCISLGCTLPQTFYSVDRVYAQNGKPTVLICQGRSWNSLFFWYQTDRKYFLADLKFKSDTDVGAPHLSDTVHVADDAPEEDSIFACVSGAPLVVQVQIDYGFSRDNRADLIDLKTHRRRRISSAPLIDGMRDVCAITRSGSRLLAVDAKSAILYDTATAKAVTRESDLLVEARRLVIEKCGIPGDWFLTDDSRYVIISPPRDIHEGGGLTGYKDPTLIRIAGTPIDLSRNGIIIELATGTIALYPRQLDSDSLTDVENVNGQLQFLYASYGRARLTDSKGVLMAAHSVSERRYGNNAFAGWDPQSGDMWFHTAEGKMILQSLPAIEADHLLICWKTATNEEKRYRITGEQIAQAITKTPRRQ